MKPILIFGLFILILVFAQTAYSQTADDIIEKYITAMGGKEKLSTLNSYRMEGTMSVQGAQVVMTITKLHGVGLRTDIAVMGTQNYQIVTPASGTIFMPVMGQTEPDAMPDDQLKAGQTGLDLKGVFVNYKEKGITVELAGKETVDGAECYKLKVTFKNGNTTHYFIDTKTSRVNKTTTIGKDNGQEMEMFTTYTNYKQNADGFWFAYTTTNNRGETNFDKVETNIKVDEGIFK